MDPQERVFIESVYRAIQDAGYTQGILLKQERLACLLE